MFVHKTSYLSFNAMWMTRHTTWQWWLILKTVSNGNILHRISWNDVSYIKNIGVVFLFDYVSFIPFSDLVRCRVFRNVPQLCYLFLYKSLFIAKSYWYDLSCDNGIQANFLFCLRNKIDLESLIINDLLSWHIRIFA